MHTLWCTIIHTDTYACVIYMCESVHHHTHLRTDAGTGTYTPVEVEGMVPQRLIRVSWWPAAHQNPTRTVARKAIRQAGNIIWAIRQQQSGNSNQATAIRQQQSGNSKARHGAQARRHAPTKSHPNHAYGTARHSGTPYIIKSTRFIRGGASRCRHTQL